MNACNLEWTRWDTATVIAWSLAALATLLSTNIF